MTTPNAPEHLVCPLRVSERALLALRDDSGSQAEAARLATHIATCPACSERLAAFDALADILRSERPPEPDGRLWPTITTAAGAPAHLSRLRFARVSPAGAAWSRVGALVAVLLLAIGFVALFSLHRPAPPTQHTPTATLAPTVTPSPGLLPMQPLDWRQVGVSSATGTVAFAEDGVSAYKCAISDDAQGNSILNIWRTSDRGAHWIPAHEVPNDPTVNGCQLVVDASDPSVATLAWQPRGGGAGDSYTGLMTTVDGGVTWQTVPSQPFTHIDQLDSRGGEIFALRETVRSTSNSVAYHLWASGDRMRSWRQVDHELPDAVAGFWLQPDGPGILVVVSGGADGIASQLWNSPDDGATWRQLSVPGGLPSYLPARFTTGGPRPNGIVARSVQGRFHICVANDAEGAPAQNSPSSNVRCSMDGGATWQARTEPPTAAAKDVFAGVNLVAVTSEGALLVSGAGVLYRLAASASQWQSLGPLPEPVVFYCPVPGAGILWAAPGSIGDSVDPQNRIFTASYTP